MLSIGGVALTSQIEEERRIKPVAQNGTMNLLITEPRKYEKKHHAFVASTSDFVYRGHAGKERLGVGLSLVFCNFI